MKTQASKKLVLNKKNIVELNDVNLNNVKGGGPTQVYSIIPPMNTSHFCNKVQN